MKPILFNQSVSLPIASVNQLAASEPEKLVLHTQKRYQDQLSAVVEAVLAKPVSRKVVLLAGPTASGKTSVAHDLAQGISQKGAAVQVISMDDFYLGYYPLLPDGTENFESFDALDMDLMDRCFHQLLTEGKTQLPQFDFVTVSRSSVKKEIELPEDGVLIIEGIHALNPRVSLNLPQEGIFRLCARVNTWFVDEEGETLLTPKNIRLMRRMLRDKNFRNYSLINTLGRWDHVLSEERICLDPYMDFVDGYIESALDYEPGAFRYYLLPLLREIGCDSPFSEPVCELCDALERFEPVKPEQIPQDSLFREFAGK